MKKYVISIQAKLKMTHAMGTINKANMFFGALVKNATTECVTDLDSWSEMIIFESILTTFKLSIVFRGSWGRSVNWLESKMEPP